MLDFRPKGRSRNYMARGEQRKLLGLVLAVGLVLFLIEEAANPQRWAWMFQAGRPAAAANPARHVKVEQPAELHRRLDRDQFIAEGEHKEELPAQKKFFPGVDRALLAKVRDDTAFRPGEAAAFYHLLGILDETSESEIERSSIGPVSFTQVFGQPKEFRGDLVTIEGTVRRIQPKKAPQNDYGIAGYDLVIVEPSDRAYAVWVYVLDLPDDFPRGDKLREPITVTGFFYKRLAALSEDRQIMTWPVLLAKTVRRRAVAAAPQVNPQAETKSLIVGLAIAVLASLAVVMFVFFATRRKTHFRMPPSRPGGLEELGKEERVADVSEQLAELARQEPH